jgi:hypothetical protein
MIELNPDHGSIRNPYTKTLDSCHPRSMLNVAVFQI